MAFADNLDKAKQDWVYLLEIEVGHRIDGDSWAKDAGGDAWWISHSEGKPSKVEEDGSELTEQGSLELCNANPRTWFWDSPSRLYVHVADSGDPGDAGQILQSFIWEYYCNKQPKDSPVIFTINSLDVFFLPYLDDDDIPSIDLEITGYHEGETRQSFGEISLINADGYFDSRLADYIYEAKKVLWKVGKLGDAYADYAVLWRGWTGSIGWSDLDIKIEIEDMRRFF